MNDSTMDKEYLEQARALVASLENNDVTEAERILDQLTRLRESRLFQELGKLTREVHDTLNSFRLDSRITELVGVDIPDAKQRLEYVIRLTADSADKTLTVIEEAMPVCDKLVGVTDEIRESWDRFNRREMHADEFRELSRKISTYLDDTSVSIGQLRTNLNDVMMAQDFQDLTGQIIKRVITLVSDLENSLVNLIRLTGQSLADSKAGKGRDKEGLEGPQVPGLESSGAVSGQDEVDDLLSSLGF